MITPWHVSPERWSSDGSAGGMLWVHQVSLLPAAPSPPSCSSIPEPQFASQLQPHHSCNPNIGTHCFSQVDIEWDFKSANGGSWKKMGFDASSTSGAWAPSFVNASIPAHFTRVRGTTFAFRSAHPFNFGHVFNDNMVATVAAANMFQIDLHSSPSSRILLLENENEIRRFGRRKKNGFKWLWGLTGRNPDFIFDIADGTCYDSIIMGHTSAFSVSYFQATASVFVNQLKLLYASNLLMRSLYAPSLPSSSVRQTIPDGSRSYSLAFPTRTRHRVIFYSKGPFMENEPVWSDACSMIPGLRMMYQPDDVEFFCVGAFNYMAIEIQIQLAASASVHVMPHGGLSYLTMFASEGSGVLLLTNSFVKELQVIAQLPLLQVSVVSERQRTLLPELLHAKMISVSHSMQLPAPLLSSVGDAYLESRANLGGIEGWEDDCSQSGDMTIPVDGRRTVYRLCS